MPPHLVAPLLLGAGGLLLLALAAFVLVSRLARRKRFSRADGTVVRLRAGDSGGYLPVVVFEVSGKGPVEIEGTIISEPPAYQVGERVVVYYDPAAPRDAMIDGGSELYFIPVVLTVVSLVLFFFAGIVALR